jgi:hypothetical protein
MQQLSQLATYIATSVTEIGYTVDFTKPYADIRSIYMQKSLAPLSQSVQSSEKHKGISYEKGSSEFLKYMECFVKMVKVYTRRDNKRLLMQCTYTLLSPF